MEILREDIKSLTSHPNSTLLNEVVGSLSDRLYKAAKTCETKRTIVQAPSQEDTTPGMRAANEMLNRYSSGLCMWGDWNNVRRSAVDEISANHFAKMIKQWNETLKTNDPKKIWEKKQCLYSFQ